LIEIRGIDLSEIAAERRYHRDRPAVKGYALHDIAGLIPNQKRGAKTAALCLKFATGPPFNPPGTSQLSIASQISRAMPAEIRSSRLGVNRCGVGRYDDIRP
jgi:hypothetical protein